MSGERKYDLILGLFLAVTAAVRLVYVQDLPLLPDEANSWQWSRHLAAGYYDNGPLVALTIRAGTLLWGQTLLGLRFSGILLSLGTGLLLYDLTLRLFKSRPLGLALALAVNSTLLFGVGGLLATYDLPQAFFWTLGLNLAARLFLEERPGARTWTWAGLGVTLGLALLAKYSSLLLVFSLGGFLLFTPGKRRLLTRPGPYLALGLAFLTFLPNLIWNADHGWTAFAHVLGLSQGGGGGFRFRAPEFVGTQFLIVGPILFVLLVWGLVKALRRAREGDQVQSFLAWSWLPTLGLFTLMSCYTRVYANWPAPGYVAAALAAGGAWACVYPSSPALRRTLALALISGYLLLGLAYAHRPLVAALDPEPQADPTAEVYGWPGLGPALEEALARWPQARRPFIFSTRYQIASLAGFYTPGRPETVCLFPPGERLNQYIYWSDPRELEGRDGLGVIKLARRLRTKRFFWAGLDFDLEPVPYYRFQLAGLFQEVGPGRVVELSGPGGRVVNRVVLFRCKHFLGRDWRNQGSSPKP